MKLIVKCLIATAAVTAWACGELPVPGEGDEKKDDKKDEPKDCEAGSLVCSKPDPDPIPCGDGVQDEAETGLTCTVIDPNPKTPDGCKWVIAESYPESVSGTCVTQKEGEARFALPVKPNVESLKVQKDAEAALSFKVEPDEKNGSIVVTDQAAGVSLKISYRGAGDTAAKGQLGTIEDKRSLDGCQFLIKLDDGTVLDPIGLADEFKKEGQRVRVEFEIAKEVSTICMAGQPVRLKSIVKADGEPKGDCTAAKKVFNEVVASVEALPNSCATDDDCAIFGSMPKSECPVPHFTAKSEVAAKQKALDDAAANVNDSCPLPQAACGAAFPSKAICDQATKSCKAGNI